MDLCVPFFMCCASIMYDSDHLAFPGIPQPTYVYDLNILNKQSQTADKGWSSSLGVDNKK
jgi:hypothetical protein